MRTFSIIFIMFFPLFVVAETQQPLNNPGPNVVITNSSQDLKQSHDLFSQSGYKYFHQNKKLKLFKIPRR